MDENVKVVTGEPEGDSNPEVESGVPTVGYITLRGEGAIGDLRARLEVAINEGEEPEGKVYQIGRAMDYPFTIQAEYNPEFITGVHAHRATVEAHGLRVWEVTFSNGAEPYKPEFKATKLENEKGRRDKGVDLMTCYRRILVNFGLKSEASAKSAGVSKSKRGKIKAELVALAGMAHTPELAGALARIAELAGVDLGELGVTAVGVNGEVTVTPSGEITAQPATAALAASKGKRGK